MPNPPTPPDETFHTPQITPTPSATTLLPKPPASPAVRQTNVSRAASGRSGYVAVPGGDEEEEEEEEGEEGAVGVGVGDEEVDELHGGGEGVTGTILSSSINLTNTILGAGVLAMPGALASVGLGLGTFLIVLSGLGSIFGLTLLSLCASKVGGRNASFFAVSRLTYPSAALWFDLAIAVKCFGVSVSYLVIIRDL
ncbi:hypothetical protein HDU67_007442, partial [Dinochytrium kinnereticum]